MADKRGTTIRLGLSTHERLKRAAYMLRMSQSSIVEEALQEYFKNHNLSGGYQLNLTRSNAVLQRVGDPSKIVEVTERNGISPQQLQARYETELQEPVLLVVQEDEEWPTKSK